VPKKLETVVTHLEMTVRPAQRLRAPTGMYLAMMRAPNIPLHYYRYLYDVVGRPHNWVDRRVMSDEQLSERIHAEGIDIVVLYANGAPAGYYELDFSTEKEVTLAYFGIVEDFTGRGLGPYLLSEALAHAWRPEVEKVKVETCTFDHPAALPLYQKAGFEPVARENRTLTEPD